MSQIKEPFFSAELSSFSNSSEISFAISNAAESAKEADGVTRLILKKHLKELCELQLNYLAETK
ncbi:hypothetical protein N5J75_01545 [Pantoea brenneri]|uniref:hypothetical protein n=1 Tax=Pantoea brenneri TaxID=472694 RepID=UPI002447DDFA|nr:hypothetical protein [Pantoea brenneri]MDH2121893.1 hypothetical protein [Pantoea brenneri]